ncbi:MAG: hypothetical protein IPG08_09265 [Sphingobacteriaceae bacterium]|nr:hypothetical protein [Sphingobacteriaceae bacterium]
MIKIKAKIHMVGDTENLIINVEDNGQGFPEKNRKVFEKFYRLKNTKQAAPD